MEKILLIPTNGSAHNLPAVEYGLWLAGKLNLTVALLGIIEAQEHKKAVEAILQEAEEKLTSQEQNYSRLTDTGDAIQVICQQADAQRHLVVLGPLGRPGWERWLRGRTFRHILKGVEAPVIYAPTAHLRLERILVCMGGLGYAKSVEDWSIYLAKRLGAKVNFLHIVGPVYYEYPTANRMASPDQEILDSDTPIGRNLSKTITHARDAGVEAELKIRHGDTVHEIRTEIEEGGYDLVGLGSPESSRSLRHLYLPNITAEIADNCKVPVLTARLGFDPGMG